MPKLDLKQFACESALDEWADRVYNTHKIDNFIFKDESGAFIDYCCMAGFTGCDLVLVDKDGKKTEWVLSSMNVIKSLRERSLTFDINDNVRKALIEGKEKYEDDDISYKIEKDDDDYVMTYTFGSNNFYVSTSDKEMIDKIVKEMIFL